MAIRVRSAPTQGRFGQVAARIVAIVVGAAIGVVAALVVSVLRLAQLPASTGGMDVVPSGSGSVLWVVLGAIPGAVIGALGPGAMANAAARGLVVGLLWWAVWSLTATPILLGQAPTWSSASVGIAFADLVAGLLQAAATGMLVSLVLPILVDRRTHADRATAVAGLPHIVVIGGGFAGVAVVQRLERLSRRRHRWEVTLVSDNNYQLFTPMLPEVAGGALQAQHVGAPLRACCPRTRLVLGRVDSVDLTTRHVSGTSGEIPFDHLVVALGAEPTFHGLPGIRENCLTLKTLRDATRVREHVLAQLERADSEPEEATRRRLLTFSVIGGGFAGVELAAELRDLAHSVLRYYPSIDREELRIVLVHAGDRLLPEIGPELARFAQVQLVARGLEIRLGARVRGATGTGLLLADGEELTAATMVWTAGNHPQSVVRSMPGEHGRGGTLAVDPEMRVLGPENIWAAGDCAAVPDGRGGHHPPTAQHALREGRAVADNLARVLDGRRPQPFRFSTIGSLAALGHRTGVAEIHGWRFSGVLAWGLWRVIYLAKLPGLEKRVRVALDWSIELGFPRDIVLAHEGHAQTHPAGEGRAPTEDADR